VWKRDGVFARDVRHFFARSIYIAIFLVVTVYYSTKNTILTASAQAAMREVFVEEEWDNPYQTKTFLDIRTLDEFWAWQDNVRRRIMCDTASYDTPRIHPLYTFSLPYLLLPIGMYTRYTCRYNHIYIPNTPLNTLFTP